MRAALIDYGAGNLRSAARAFAEAGASPEIVAGPQGLRRADAIVVPGVGAFGPAMARLWSAGLVDPIRDAACHGTPLIGICLGMQLLFDESDEGGTTAGFGLIPGVVRRLPDGVKVPHMGWNALEGARGALFEGLPANPYVYFVHSYVVWPADPRAVAAEVSYGVRFPAVVRAGAVWGLQFHPEKSSRIGARLLRNLVAEIAAASARA
ncbi:MAG: imidazole glycerol phosphate synthase subunit HisH [bacterium]